MAYESAFILARSKSGGVLFMNRQVGDGTTELDVTGGKPEGCETPVQTALREFKEETGVDLSQNQLQQPFSLWNDSLQKHQWWFPTTLTTAQITTAISFQSDQHAGGRIIDIEIGNNGITFDGVPIKECRVRKYVQILAKYQPDLWKHMTTFP